jgi:hypothetical protein
MYPPATVRRLAGAGVRGLDADPVGDSGHGGESGMRCRGRAGALHRDAVAPGVGARAANRRRGARLGRVASPRGRIRVPRCGAVSCVVLEASASCGLLRRRPTPNTSRLLHFHSLAIVAMPAVAAKQRLCFPRSIVIVKFACSCNIYAD